MAYQLNRRPGHKIMRLLTCNAKYFIAYNLESNREATSLNTEHKAIFLVTTLQSLYEQEEGWGSRSCFSSLDRMLLERPHTFNVTCLEVQLYKNDVIKGPAALPLHSFLPHNWFRFRASAAKSHSVTHELGEIAFFWSFV